jgi:hypothetical protein
MPNSEQATIPGVTHIHDLGHMTKAEKIFNTKVMEFLAKHNSSNN